MSAMAFVTRPWHVLALRALLGFVAGYGPIAMTMAAESAPVESMATAIGWVQTAQRLGPALGPVAGGMLAAAVGLRRAFLVAAAVYFGALVLILVGFRERAGIRTAAPARDPATDWAALRRVPHFALMLALVFGLQLIDRSFGPVLPLYLRQVGVEADRVAFMSGVLFTTTALSAAFGNMAAGPMLARWSVGPIVTTAAAIAGVSAVVFGFGSPPATLTAAAVSFGLGLGVATTAIYAAAGQAVTAAQRGVAFGYLTTAYLIGLAVSPVVAGVIGSFDMRTVFLVDAAGLGAIVWIVSQRMGRVAAARTA
jgi:MFS family permease